MINEAARYFEEYPWQMIAPGLCIAATYRGGVSGTARVTARSSSICAVIPAEIY